jgi:transketolase
MRETCLDQVYELAKKDPRIVFVGSDLGVGTLRKFKEEMPERFHMEGISEMHLVGMSAGLALEGSIVYANTISTFLTRRCFEQVAVDVCLHNLPVRLIGNGGGLVYAPLGPTHLAIEDISIFRALPNMTIVAVADADEMKRLMPQTVDHPGPIYIRLGKGYDPIVTNDSVPFVIGKGLKMRDGGDALLITTGITLKVAQEAAAKLAEDGIQCTILHMPTIKPFDREQMLDLAGKVRAVVAIEENTVIGGLGSAVAEEIAEAGFSPGKKFKRIGIPDVFSDRYGSQANLMDYHHINTDTTVSTVRGLLGRK